MSMGRRGEWAPVAAAALAALWVGVAARDVPFIWDDFIVLRPHSWAELAGVWHGPWDPTGIVPAFYRPLSVWANAAGFAVAGFHPHLLLGIALVELAAGAALLGLVVTRETATPATGAFMAAAYALHPSVALSAGPIWFEQNHRWSVIAVAAALLAWQRVRADDTWRAWWPVHLWIWIGSLFKEDVLVTLPVIAAWQWWRARVDGGAPVRWRVHAPWLIVWTGWMLARWWLLGTIAGRPFGGPDTLADAAYSFALGPWSVLLRHRTFYWEQFAAHDWSVGIPALVGAWAVLRWRTLGGPARSLIGAGAIALVSYNVLLALGSSETRYHLLVAGAMLAVSGAVHGLSVRHGNRIAAAVAIVALAAVAAGSTATLRDLRPCTGTDLTLNDSTRGWLAGAGRSDHWAFEWLDLKTRSCASGRAPAFIDAMPALAADIAAGRRR